MRKLVLILIASIALVTFIRAVDYDIGGFQTGGGSAAVSP
jgi:hypothetical protein